MGEGYRFFQVSALGLALACVVLASQPACADITVSCDTFVTLVEGTSGHITCTLTNSTSGDITIHSSNPFLAGVIGGSVIGDSTDVATSPGVSGSGSSPCTAGGTVSAGKTCQFTVSLNTDNPAGETDHDSASGGWEVIVRTNPSSVHTYSEVTVNDPAPVPEPASVVLLGIGSGLLGALGLLCRKLL